MAHRLLTVFAFCLALFAGAGVHANAAPSNGPTTAYCTPPNTLADGQNYDAAVFNANWTYGATCPGQYGDLFTDGPLVGSAAFTYFSTSLNFTIPSVTWVAQGQRIVTTAVPETAPANTTTYWWLSTATDSFTSTLTSSPPDNFSVLEYTIVTSGTGITSVTNPTAAAEVIAGNLLLSALPSGSCLQTSTGGVITATGLPCGSGSGAIAGVNGSGNITASTVSGTATVGEVNNPTWTGSPSINGGTTTGQLNFGSDATASLQRTGTNAFQFVSGSNPTVTSAGGFLAGSSTYGPTSASVNGGLTATSVTASGLSSGNCVQVTTGGLLATTSGPCLTGSGIIAISATGNLTASTVSGTTTIGIVNAPTFSGAVTASQINASGAGLTSGTVPNAALVTAPVTSIGVSAPLGTSGGTTPTLSIVTNPAFSGTPTASGFTASGPLIAGSATAFVPTLGDLSASEGASSGALYLGGTTSKCKIDFGLTTGSTLTSGCNTTVVGTITGTTLVGTGLTPGDCVQVTTGGQLTNTGSACGSATSVTAVNGGGPVTASTVSGTVTLGCPTCVVGLTAGSNVTVGSGTSPSVALVNSPAVSGSLGVDGNAAPAHGVAAGTGSTAATFTSGVSGSASNSFVLTAANCGTVNLVEFVNGSTAEDQFGCNGTLQVGSSTYGPTSASVNGAIGVDSNSAGSSGITGGVAGTNPFNLTAASNTSATEGFVFNTSSACHASTDTFFNAKVNGTTEFYGDCSGDLYGSSFNTSGTSFTPGQCSVCIGSTGIATGNSNGIKLGNAAVATTGVTVISTANSGTVAGVACTALQITNTANRVDCLDNGGDQGISGNGNYNGYVEGGEATGPSCTSGDLCGSRSTTTGALNIGGSTTSDIIDFGVTTPGVETHSQPIAIPSLSVTTGIGTDGNAAPASGLQCGIAGTTPCNFKDKSNTTTTEGYVFDSTTGCHASTDTFFNVKVNGTSKATADCSGDWFGATFQQNGTNTTACFICTGTLGVATSTSNGISMGNAAVASTGVTIINAANSGNVAGIANSVLGVNNTGTRELAIDTNGNLGMNGGVQAANAVIAGQGTAPTATNGDLVGSRSTTTGALNLGGSSSSCLLDFNLTIGGELNANCGFNVNGQLSATGNIISSGSGTIVSTLSGPIIAGGTTAPTALVNGYVYSSNTASSGGLVLGGTTHRGILNFGNTAANTWAFASDSASTALQVTGSILGCTPVCNGPTLASGDLGASEGASSGQIKLGGSTLADTIDFGITTASVETHSANVAVPALKNTGLSSSTVSPLCGASGTNESQCTVTPSFATTGHTSVATGTTANTYQQLGATQSITTGVSHGPNGEWLVTITEPLSVVGAASESVYGCFSSASTFTLEDYTSANASTCTTALTNSVAGTTNFGLVSGAIGSLGSVATAHVLVANNTTLSVAFYVAGSTTTSATVYGYGSIVAEPY
jgi:hypothetical protein